MGNQLYYSSPKWQELRQEALRRSSECEKCGSKDELTVHHKNYHNFGGKETIDDLVVLCWECHRDTHEAEEKFWVSLVNAIESIEQAINDNKDNAFNAMEMAPFLGIQDKDNYLIKLYLDLASRKEAFGSSEFIGIHECHICINKLDKYPFCRKSGKYGCVPLK
jgi:hypothetical protein